MKQSMETDLMTTGEVSRMFRVSRQAVTAWIQLGKIPAFKTPGGRYRILRADLVRFFQKNNHPVPSGLLHDRAHILIVDDERPILDILLRLISIRYPRVMVDTAEDGISALDKIAQSTPDLVILDIRMPRMDGIEVIRRLRNEPAYGTIKILPMSGDPGALNGTGRSSDYSVFRKGSSFQKLVESLPAYLPHLAGRVDN